MHDRLLANLAATEPLTLHAQAIGLDTDEFDVCLDGEKYAEDVRKDMAGARKAGTTGTPSFVLARTDANDLTTVKGLTFIRGAQPMSQFKTVIDSALADQ